MAIIIGSARIGENGKITGGKDGDQTKREVSTQNFYVHSKGWYILRAKDPKVANKLAKAMKIACNNSNIGYNQNERYDVVKQGIETTKKCNSDCSALVRACIIWATGVDVGNFRTVDEVKFLEKSGLFEKHKSYTKQSDLCNGDILVTKTKGHTVIVVSGAKDKTKKTKTTAPASSAPTYKVGNTYTLQANLKVRKGAGTNYAQKLRIALTKNGKKNAKAGVYAVLKKSTKVTVKKVIKKGNDIWLKIPSGYVAAYYNKNTYIK